MSVHDRESITQLREFHELLSVEPPKVEIDADRLEHLAVRSMLIAVDPAAADGHEEVMFDLVGLPELRALVYAAWSASGRTVPAETLKLQREICIAAGRHTAAPKISLSGPEYAAAVVQGAYTEAINRGWHELAKTLKT